MGANRRIRDPLYDLIEFDKSHFGNMLWDIVQAPSFQRLRRIKQLGFSDYVYPGATHSRFSHSLGVFHIAQRLIALLEAKLGREGLHPEKANRALAAALVHDIGHGPFSHAFEMVGKELNLSMVRHERVSGEIIKNSEIGKIFDTYDEGLARKIADLILAKGYDDIYGAIVSSQFDADRLDYMQRDRLMAGTKLGGIDFSWLLANLEISKIQLSTPDGEQYEKETFVLNPKAIHAAEAYVLSLFQLYPALYFHKATRCLERMFSKLLVRLFTLIGERSLKETGLNQNHPLVRFCKSPKELDRYLALDDNVILGAIPQLKEAKDPTIARFAQNLQERKLYQCFDLSEKLVDPASELSTQEYENAFTKARIQFSKIIEEWVQDKKKADHVFMDDGERKPYKEFSEEGSPLNQIRVQTGSGQTKDINDVSPIVRAIKPFRFYRVYVDREDGESCNFVRQQIDQHFKGE